MGKRTPTLLWLLSLLLSMAVGLPSARGGPGKRMALVIGNDHYDFLPPGSQLDQAVNDANRLAETLKNLKPQFEVTLLTDQTRKEAGVALRKFMEEAKEAECVLFYYAGHGMEYHGANYLLMKDTDFEIEKERVPEVKDVLDQRAVRLEVLIDMLSETNAGLTITILDACRDNPMEAYSSALPDGGSGESPVAPSRAKTDRLGHVTAPSGMLISYAADVGESANDGLFTEILTENIKTPGRSIMEVFANTRVDVRNASQLLSLAQTGVAHEPAEYCKLDPAGLRFSFLPGDTANPPSHVNKPVFFTFPGPGGNRPSADPDISAEQVDELYQKLIGKEKSISDRKREIGGIKMIWCSPTDPEGTIIGSPEDEKERNDDEEERSVILTRGYWLAETELTIAEWNAVKGFRSKHSGNPQYPVNRESWEGTRLFLEAKNKDSPLPPGWRWDLPTEAQWEIACRAGSSKPFPYSDRLTIERSNFSGKDGANIVQTGLNPKLKTVAGLKSNRLGFYDMHGNVQEWCRDWYSKNPPGLTNPLGPEKGEFHVVRGGSFRSLMRNCRSSVRNNGREILSAGFRPAIVFSDTVAEKSLQKKQPHLEGPNVIDLTNISIYGVGFGNTREEIRAALKKQNLFEEEKEITGITVIFGKNVNFRFRGEEAEFCNEINCRHSGISLSNGLTHLDTLVDFENAFGRPIVHRTISGRPDTSEWFFSNGPTTVSATVYNEADGIVGQITIYTMENILLRNEFTVADIENGSILGIGLGMNPDEVRSGLDRMGILRKVTQAPWGISIQGPLCSYIFRNDQPPRVAFRNTRVRLSPTPEGALRVGSKIKDFQERFGSPISKKKSSVPNLSYWTFTNGNIEIVADVQTDKPDRAKAISFQAPGSAKQQ